ncbi:MAG: CbiX/SirB N-terminal domain-containing protein [Synechococcaceae cyanobacterium]
MIALVSALPSPADLPASGDSARWPWLQRLRHHPALAVEPWLRAIETGALAPEADLLTALAEHLDAGAELRLLSWWAAQPSPDPRLPELLGRRRDPRLGAWLLARLRDGPAALQQAGLAAAVAAGLLPLLGAQRQPQAWPALKSWLLAPAPAPLRRAALEGIAVGMPVWPRADLHRCLQQLVGDLDPRLAAGAVDLLARLPGCRRLLVPLARRRLDPCVSQRLQRRLAATPVQPLLLVVHGRSAGALPAELLSLAVELEQRRGAPVRLQALTAAAPPEAGLWLRAGPRLTLVPLLLLPGGHVRQDVPAIAAHWRRRTSLQRLPFLGAWPRWQQALRAEVEALAEAAAGSGTRPLLLHHPLTTPLAGRYLDRLEQVTGGRALAAPYSADHPAEFQLPRSAPALPLALAANRFTDRLGDRVGPPLLQRQALRQLLLEELEALP